MDFVQENSLAVFGPEGASNPIHVRDTIRKGLWTSHTSGLAHCHVQCNVVILPEVDAGTASLVAGIAVNPLVGLTTFLAQLYLQSPLSRASIQEFLIDGSWTAPRVKRVEPEPAQPAAPRK